MKKIAFVITILLACGIYAQSELEGRDLVILDNKISKLIIDVGGGSIAEFSLNDIPVNPLHTYYPDSGFTEPKGFGHFLCLDRRGAPSKNEAKNGMRFHGEAFRIMWDVQERPKKINDGIYAKVSCLLPIGQLQLDREIILYKKKPVYKITEHITNKNKLGRMFNMMQHVSIGGEFLDSNTIFDCNNNRGFLFTKDWKEKEEQIIYWPKAIIDGHAINFRKLIYEGIIRKGVPFAPEDENDIGWMTACNPKQGLLIGYIWKISQYPWTFYWRDFDKETFAPRAYCTEFGSAAIGRSFGDLFKHGPIFNRPLVEYIDADETITKEFVSFLAKIPEDYKGVSDVEIINGRIVIIDYEGNRENDIVIKVDVEF